MYSTTKKKRIGKFEKSEEIRVPTSNQCFSFQQKIHKFFGYFYFSNVNSNQFSIFWGK
jgi:hypothetical protein